MIKKLAITLSGLGILVSSYMFYEKMIGGQLVCGVSSCNEVNSSPYSSIWGISVSLFGVIYYLMILFFLAFNKYKLFFYSTIIGLLFTGYLTFLEAFVIKAWCQWCLLSAWLVVSLFILSFKLLKK